MPPFWTMSRIERAERYEERDRLISNHRDLPIWDLPLNQAEYFIIDIETSGFSAQTDLVLSLAAGRLQGTDFSLEQYDIVRQARTEDVPEEIWLLTGLTPEQVQSGLEWRDVLFRALSYSANRVWIAHHARHELSFLQRSARLFWKMKLRPICIDTAVVAQALCRLPAVPTLDSVCDWLEIPVTDRHRADADVMATAEVWKREIELCRKLGLETVGDVVDWSIAYASG